MSHQPTAKRSAIAFCLPINFECKNRTATGARHANRACWTPTTPALQQSIWCVPALWPNDAPCPTQQNNNTETIMFDTPDQATEFVDFWNEILAEKFITWRHILVDGLAHHSAT